MFDMGAGEEDISMLAAEGQGPEDHSMRVTYEDPHQNDERKRLMQLLESQKKEIWELDAGPVPASSVAKPAQKAGPSRKGKGAPSRRSSRVAGF